MIVQEEKYGGAERSCHHVKAFKPIFIAQWNFTDLKI